MGNHHGRAVGQQNDSACRRSRRHAHCDRPAVGGPVPAAAKEPAAIFSLFRCGCCPVRRGSSRRSPRGSTSIPPRCPTAMRLVQRVCAKSAMPAAASFLPPARHASSPRRSPAHLGVFDAVHADRRAAQSDLRAQMHRAGRGLWRWRLRLRRQQPTRPQMLRCCARGDRRRARPACGALAVGRTAPNCSRRRSRRFKTIPQDAARPSMGEERADRSADGAVARILQRRHDRRHACSPSSRSARPPPPSISSTTSSTWRSTAGTRPSASGLSPAASCRSPSASVSAALIVLASAGGSPVLPPLFSAALGAIW